MQILYRFMLILNNPHKRYPIMSFGKKLKEIRNQHHLTQMVMSEKLAMEQSTYSRYESDKRIPTIDVLNRLAETFKVNLDSLMNENSKTVIFEKRSDSNIDEVETENYYAVLKGIIETMRQQQENITLLLQQVLRNKS